MEEAVRTRRAAREATRDIQPQRLWEVIDGILHNASMAPGVLTLLCARAAGGHVDQRAIEARAAGVQLIYEGLRLTRVLAQTEPWARDGDEPTESDLDILAADVLVARGFYLLARTEAAAHAVETVRAFGRDQTVRRNAGRDGTSIDRNLEIDVFELAVVAGTTAVGVAPPASLRTYAADVAASVDDPLPDAEAVLGEPVVDSIEECCRGEGGTSLEGTGPGQVSPSSPPDS